MPIGSGFVPRVGSSPRDRRSRNRTQIALKGIRTQGIAAHGIERTNWTALFTGHEEHATIGPQSRTLTEPLS